MNKRIAAGISAGLVAGAFAISCVPPVTVHADDDEFAEYVDNAVDLASTAVETLGSTEALTFAGYALVFAALANADDLYNWATETGEAVELPTHHIAIRGEYVYRGKTRQGVLMCYQDGMRTSKGFSAPLFKSPDLTVEVGYMSSSDVTVLWSNGGVPNNSQVTMQTYRLATSVDWTTSLGSGGNGYLCGLSYCRSPAPNWGAVLPDASYIKTLYNSPPYIMAAGDYVDLPGDDFEPAEIAHKWNADVLPALQQYPTLEPYLPEPFDEPVEPIYPTGEYVTGIPKDWTIENPDIPEYPHIGFDIPDADFDVIKPSEQIAEYTDGIGFWWALTSRLLDVTNLKVIAVLALGLGVLGFVLWHLGR